MKRATAALAVILCACLVAAKDKQTITLQIVDAQGSTRTQTYNVPGTPEYSKTRCSTNGTATDNGTNTTTIYGTTDCKTTTIPATPPSTRVVNVPQMHVFAIMPDGRHLTLWCQVGWRYCSQPSAGTYTAEIEGNVVWLHVFELGGKEHRVKYHYVGGW